MVKIVVYKFCILNGMVYLCNTKKEIRRPACQGKYLLLCYILFISMVLPLGLVMLLMLLLKQKFYSNQLILKSALILKTNTTSTFNVFVFKTTIMKTTEEKAEECYRFAVCSLKLTVHLQWTQQYNEHGKSNNSRKY